MMVVFLFTLGIGQMWAADVVHTYEFKNYNSTKIPTVSSANTKNNVTTGHSFTVSPAEDNTVNTTFYYGAGTTSTTVKTAAYHSSDGVKYTGCGYFVFVLSQSANVKITTKTITSTWGVDAVTDGAYTWSNFTTVVDGTYATLNNNAETDLGTLAAGRYKFYYGSNSSWAVKKLVITYPSCSTEITTQPSDASLAIGAANPELSIVATNADSYAWKESSDGTSKDGSSTLSTSASYTPEVNDAVQTKYYYCEVTSDCDGTTVVESDIVTVEVVESIVNVTGVSLDKTSQEFTLGATTTTTLTATVAPNDATNKAISWESSAPTKVSVTDNGDGTADIEGLAEGTATITVTTDDGSYTATCNVTVHPDPCHKYFWFSKAADATTAGVTNNEGSFFTTSASGSNGTTSSITIDEVEYAITNRTGNIGADDATIVSFTIPANKAGVLYVNMASSGNKGESSSRTLYLKKGGVTIVTATNAIYGDGAQHNATIENIPSGTYTLHANNNVKVGMFALKVCDATFHTITLDLDGGTGATSIQALDGVPATKPTDPTKDNNEFAGWVVKSTGVAYDWDAIVSADVVLKATWTPAVVKHTISFNSDGGTAVEPIEVEDGQAATAPTAPKKAGYEFDKWYNGESVYDWSAAVTGDLALTAHWNKVYVPQGANYSFAGQGTMGTAPKAITVTTDNEKNSIANYSRVDNIFFSAMDVYCESGTTGGDDAATGFKGWKIKTSGATIKFYVENDSRVSITMGTLSSGCNITYTAKGASSTTTTALTGGAPYYTDNYNVAAGSLVTLTTQGGNTVTLKGIAVSAIPAKDNDATLKDLKVGGVTIAGFAAATYTYYYELPYGTDEGDIPTITASANSTKALQVAIEQAVWTDAPYNCYRAQANVQAEDESWGYYDVRFVFAPKYGVELIKATHDGTAAGATITGYIGGQKDKDTYANGKLGEVDKYFGIKLAEGKFQAGDLVEVKASMLEGGNTATMFTDKGETALNSGAFDVNLKVYRFTLTEETEWIYIYRKDGSCNPRVQHIAVYRQMAPFIESFEIAGVEDFVIDQEYKTITASVANSFDVTALTPTVKYWGNGGGAIDKTGAQDFTDPVTYKVSSAYAEDATGDYAPVTYTVTITKVVPSVEPTITTQPQGANYIEGASINALTVVAESTAGELSYQWQVKNGPNYEDIEGATAYSYAPAVSAIGSYTYRVVVTNTEESKPATSVESEDATIVIAADPACATFLEEGIPTEAPYKYVNTGEWTLYNANSSGKNYSSNNAFTTGKNFQGVSVKVFSKERCVLIFEKDMKQVRFYAAECERDWVETAPVKVSEDVEAFLDGGTPSYTTESATTSMNNSYATDGKCRILTAQGNFEAGKCYWFSFTGGVKIFKICAVEADPKADAPVFSGTLSDEAICPGASFATLDATAAPVTSYKWYKDDEIIAGATAATYAPTEAGTYYCIATNSAAGHRDNSLKSAEAVLSVNVTTAITAHVDAVGLVDAEKTISVTAEGTSLTYKWQACDVNGTVTDATVLGTAASLNITIASETKYYLATVTGTCGTETQVVEARMWAHHDPAHVTATTTWDWTNAAWNGVTANIEFANTSVEELMSNVSADVPCLDGVNGFRSDMLYGTGQYVYRPNNKFFQGFKVRFIADVPGIVKVTYRGTGDSKYIILHINDSTYAQYKGGFKTVEALVPAGQVLIEGVGGTDNAGGMTRIQKIEFIADLSGYALADADKTRAVTEGRFGTICMPKGGKVVNGAIFEIAYMDYKDSKPYKIYFDEVVNGLMEPGMPYIFLPNEGAETLGIVSTANKVDDAGHFHGLYGSFTQELLAQNAGNYILQNNQYYYVNSADVYVGANRAYIKLAEVPSYDPGQPAYGRRRVSMNVNAEQVVTDIDNLNAGEQPVKMMIDGKLYILRGEKMFDATGRLVK